MAGVRTPLPVQLVAGLIANPKEGFERARAELVKAFGETDLESPAWDFDFTDYYAREMGEGLARQFVAFGALAQLDGLQRVKLVTNDIEARIAGTSACGVRRPVNIDPGYVCHSKLVLFSTKDFSHRIYVGDNIYAENTLEWRGGEFVEHPWTFPDYRTEKYRNFFAKVRVNYERKLKLPGFRAV